MYGGRGHARGARKGGDILVLGGVFSGVIEEIGGGVSGFSVGDEVAGMNGAAMGCQRISGWRANSACAWRRTASRPVRPFFISTGLA